MDMTNIVDNSSENLNVKIRFKNDKLKLDAQAAAFVAAAGSCLSLLIVFATVPSLEKPRDSQDKNVFNLSEVHSTYLAPTVKQREASISIGNLHVLKFCNGLVEISKETHEILCTFFVLLPCLNK
jgi:hypothetical protein